jgi:hypothetical protein
LQLWLEDSPGPHLVNIQYLHAEPNLQPISGFARILVPRLPAT